jgi:hypothetical protein
MVTTNTLSKKTQLVVASFGLSSALFTIGGLVGIIVWYAFVSSNNTLTNASSSSSSS